MNGPTTVARTHLDWESLYRRYPAELALLEDRIQYFENRAGLTLTPGAIEILLIPLVEGLDNGELIDAGELDAAFDQVFTTLVADPDERDEGRVFRSSRSMLRSIFKNWCKIPPICTRGRGRQ